MKSNSSPNDIPPKFLKIASCIVLLWSKVTIRMNLLEFVKLLFLKANLCSADFWCCCFGKPQRSFVTGRRHAYFRQVVRAPQPCRTLKIVVVFKQLYFHWGTFRKGRFCRSPSYESPYCHFGINLIFNCEVTKNRKFWSLLIFGRAAGPCAIEWQYNTMQEIFLIRQDDRKPLRMKSTAKQENKFNFKRNIYIPKMCVDPGPGGLQHTHWISEKLLN